MFFHPQLRLDCGSPVVRARVGQNDTAFEFSAVKAIQEEMGHDKVEAVRLGMPVPRICAVPRLEDDNSV